MIFSCSFSAWPCIHVDGYLLSLFSCKLALLCALLFINDLAWMDLVCEEFHVLMLFRLIDFIDRVQGWIHSMCS